MVMVWSKERKEWVMRPEGARALAKKRVSEAMDRRDAIRLADTHLNLTRCVGGRVQRDGFTCAHCGGQDWSTACPWAGIDRSKSDD